MKTLAIISTFDDLCGIAGYTKALVRQLQPHLEIKVFDLDQFLFRNESKRGQRLADEEIGRICAELPKFDYVNIQLEHGTLGRKQSDIVKRTRRLIQASKNIVVTFHTINKPPRPIANILFSRKTFSRPLSTWAEMSSTARENSLDRGIFSALRDSQRKKPTAIIVHTKRDERSIRVMQQINNVRSHPLAFYSTTEANAIKSQNRTLAIRESFNLGSNDVLLGCFGFIGEYKGLDTAINALKLLPANFHLAIFGGLHPNEIRLNMHKDESFHRKLVESIRPNDRLIDEAAKNGISMHATADELRQLISSKHPENLVDRVHFAGALSDDKFAESMVACDTVLLPYLEVGQASSGPLSIACDLGCHFIASRTKAFMQFARFNPNRFSMFDVGNHIELAQIILRETSKKSFDWPAQIYNTESNVLTYLEAFGHQQ